MDIKKNFSTERVVGHWYRLPRELGSSRNVWMMLLAVWFSFRQSC